MRAPGRQGLLKELYRRYASDGEPVQSELLVSVHRRRHTNLARSDDQAGAFSASRVLNNFPGCTHKATAQTCAQAPKCILLLVLLLCDLDSLHLLMRKTECGGDRREERFTLGVELEEAQD